MNSRLVKQTLFTAALVTVGGNIFGRLFGYAREALVAKAFGTSAILDTFLIAFTVPEILTFVIFAAIPTGVISSSSRIAGNNGDREASLFWKGLIAFGFTLAALTGLLFLFKDAVLWSLAPEMRPDLVPLARHLFKILAAVVFFRGLEAYFRAWLFKRKHFAVPALSSLILNGVIIASLMLAPGVTITALAYGWLFASIVLFLLHAAAAFGLLRPSPKLSGAAMAPMFRLTLSVAAIEAAFLVFPAVDRYLALRFLGEGEIAALRYALFVSQLPPGMLVVTFSAAAFPWITDLAADIEPEKLKEFYRDSVRMVMYVMLPVVTGMIIFSYEVIQVAFQRGAFDSYSVVLTSGPLYYYSLGLLFYSVYFYQIRYYYAKQLLARLGIILAGSLAVKLIASWLLIGPLGHNGLALATSIAWLSSFLIMTIDLKRTAGLSFISGSRKWALTATPALAVTIGFWFVIANVWQVVGGYTLLARGLRLTAIGASGMGVYLILGLLFKTPEALRLRDAFFNRARRLLSRS